VATQTSASAGVDVSATEIIGTARGIFPGRVVWVHNPAAAKWDGQKGYWWEDANLDQSVVNEMLSRGLLQQTGASDEKSAWDALSRYFNESHKKPGSGYLAGEKIAIKVNMNTVSKANYKGNGAFTSPQLIFTLLEQLVKNAGVTANAITVYDAIRYIPDCIYDRCQTPELKGVRFVDYEGGKGREKSERDLNVQMQWSEDVKGSPTYLPTVVTQASYMINIGGLKGHNLAGVTLCAKNHFGTIMADWKGQVTLNAPQGANLHATVAAHAYSWGEEWTWPKRPMGTYNALVDLIGHPDLGGKTLLYLVDGLYAVQNQNADVASEHRWQSAPFNGHWTSSLLFSQDNLAIDSVGLDMIYAEPSITALPDIIPPGSTTDNYLHEAAKADKSPSGTVYKPDGKTVLGSLGVHEHWNNANDKQYSRNLKTGEGIELLKVS
jgi:hypothetical protein